jgi:hypothetical protein
MHWDQFTGIDLEALTTPEVLERGFNYYRNGHLITAARIDNILAGIVIGTGGDYQTRLWIENESVHHWCSCPYPDFCKHSVAVAYGWLESKASFIDLRPLLDAAIQDSPGLPGLFARLVYQNPINFMKLMDARQALPKSQSPSQASREMVNLIRNIFNNAPLFRLSHIEVLRDKLARAENLLGRELAAGNPEALPLFIEMLQGLAEIYKENKLPELAAYLNGLLSLPVKAALRFTKEAIDELYPMILQSYFDPDLWEFKEKLKEILLGFHEAGPEFLPRYLINACTIEHLNARSESNSAGILNLIGFYELLATEAIVQNNFELNGALENVVQSLKSTVEGRLWLIDRLMAADPAESYRLTRTALAGGMEPKRSFRDRLITIHWQRSEFRQAASLSFIQFQEEPNFEEYLRLKNILKNHPADWQSYLNRLRDFLDKTGNGTLGFQIAINLGDGPEISARLKGAAQTPSSLLEAAGLLLERGAPEIFFAEVYPQVIRLLLEEKIFSCWNAALRMIIALKKICFQTGQAVEWETFRMKLIEEHPDDGRFRRKFGAVLGMTGNL